MALPSNPIRAVETADWMPFGEAMRQIKDAGFRFGQNRWETWVDSGLMDKAKRIPGTNDHGFSAEQWEKLKRLIVIDSQLFGRKSPQAIAYYAATSGLDVPPRLVADHIVSSIHTFYRTLRRRIIQQSSGRRDPRMLSESDALKLAKKAASDIVQLMPRIRNPAKRFALGQFTEAVAFVIISAAYAVKMPRTFGESVRSIANGLFHRSSAALGATMLRKSLERTRNELVDPTFGSNKLIEVVQIALATNPLLILRACRDSGIVFESSIKGFGLTERHRRGRPPNDAKGTARENARAFYALLPMVSALFLSMNIDNPNNRFLMMLRKDEGAAFAQHVRRLDRVAEWQQRRLEKGL